MRHYSAQQLIVEVERNDSTHLSELVNIEDPRDVLDEVNTVAKMAFPEFESEQLSSVLKDIVRLFSGKYPGYRACNTEYHDLQHSMDTLLATARLIQGAAARGLSFDNQSVTLGLISAIMHDTGYIQHSDDRSGTGAKYTLVHVERSIDFMEIYFSKNGYPQDYFHKCRNIVLWTDLHTDTSNILTDSKEYDLLGKILGTADLLCQMASRTYIEKLLFLFSEFKEGDVPGFDSEVDLLCKTLQFCQTTKNRFAGELGGVNNFMRTHFELRWGINDNPYDRAIENQMKYLKSIIENHPKEYRAFLKRGGLVKKLTKLETNDTVIRFNRGLDQTVRGLPANQIILPGVTPIGSRKK